MKTLGMNVLLALSMIVGLTSHSYAASKAVCTDKGKNDYFTCCYTAYSNGQVRTDYWKGPYSNSNENHCGDNCAADKVCRDSDRCSKQAFPGVKMKDNERCTIS